MNKIILIGNVVHTPEMRVTQSGINVCSFSIAVRRRFKNPQTGEAETDFFEIQAWRQLAELCGKYLEKGRKVSVVGSMQSRTYTGKDGTTKKAWDVVADEVEFLTPKSENTAPDPNARKYPDAAYMHQQAAALSPTAGFTQVDEEELPF